MNDVHIINIKLWYGRQQINIVYSILLVLAGLHYHKKISDEKLKGQFKALKEGTLQKRKGTYHCTINNQWYNDESAYEVFQDCINDKNINTIPFLEFIKYISLFENKNYNYALNVFGSEYIYPFFNYWNPEYMELEFSNYIDFYIPNIRMAIKNDNCCYECGHCHTTYDKNSKVNITTINNWIHSLKKGNLSKIPKFDISSRSPHGSWW